MEIKTTVRYYLRGRDKRGYWYTLEENNKVTDTKIKYFTNKADAIARVITLDASSEYEWHIFAEVVLRTLVDW